MAPECTIDDERTTPVTRCRPFAVGRSSDDVTT
jgi:hypothetical protein